MSKQDGLHLLVVTGYWPNELNPITGLFVVQQVAAFARLGHKITIVVSNVLGKNNPRKLSVEELGLPDRTVCLVDISSIRLPEKLVSVAGALKINIFLSRCFYRKGIARLVEAGSDFDGCIVHGIRYAGLSYPGWKQHLKCNTVMVIHGCDPFFEVDLNLKRSLNGVAKVMEHLNTVVLVGSPLKAHAARLKINSNKCMVIANGTDIPDLIDNSSIRAKGAIARIVSVSNLIPLKGVDLNLQALSSISRCRPDLKWSYSIIGDGPERDRLIQLSRSLGISDRVSFMGRLNYTSTMDQIGEADIFSLPSWGEAFGIVYLEAMARFKPVIGCFENGLSDFITDGKEGILVPPKDVTALSIALQSLIENPKRCCEMGKHGRATAEMYDWEANAKRMLIALGL